MFWFHVVVCGALLSTSGHMSIHAATEQVLATVSLLSDVLLMPCTLQLHPDQVSKELHVEDNKLIM